MFADLTTPRFLLPFEQLPRGQVPFPQRIIDGVELQQQKNSFVYNVFVFLLYMVLLRLFSDIAVLSAVSSTSQTNQQQQSAKKGGKSSIFTLGAKDDPQRTLLRWSELEYLTLIHNVLTRRRKGMTDKFKHLKRK